MSAAVSLTRAQSHNSPRSAKDDELQVMDRAGAPLHLQPNQTIFTEGEPVDCAYKVVGGAVRLCKHLPDGRRQIAQFLFPGDYFSFVAIGDHGFSAEAIGDVSLLAFRLEQVERLCRQDQNLRARLFEILSQRVRDIQNHLTAVGRQTAKERVAAFLLLLAERMSMDGTRIEVPMNRQDIADHLGLTMETVSRTLSLLKGTHIIAVPDAHWIELKNLDALHVLAEGME